MILTDTDCGKLDALQSLKMCKYQIFFSSKILKQKTAASVLFKRTGWVNNNPLILQIQIQMCEIGLKFCDFVVWSCKETFITRVRYNHFVWSAMKEKLIQFHYSCVSPDLFEMGVPYELSVVDLPWYYV